MTGGTVHVNGPTANNNGALYYDVSFKTTGGFLLAVGSSAMAQAPGGTSTQYHVKANCRSTKPAGALVRLQVARGEVVTFAPAKAYPSVVFSSVLLQSGVS